MTSFNLYVREVKSSPQRPTIPQRRDDLRSDRSRNFLQNKIKEVFQTNFSIVSYDPLSKTVENSLLAAGVRNDTEVILPVIANKKILKAILDIGAIPRFVDVTDANAIPDLAKIKETVNGKTSAIISNPLWGYPATTYQLADFSTSNKISLITDFTRSIGVKNGNKYEGTFGTLGYFFTSLDSIIRTDEQYGVVLTDNKEVHDKFLSLTKISERNQPKTRYNSTPFENYEQACKDLKEMDLYIEQLHARFWKWNNILVDSIDIMQPVWFSGAVKYNYQTVLFSLSEEAEKKLPADKLIDLIILNKILPDYKNNRITLLDNDSSNLDKYPNANFLKHNIFPLRIDFEENDDPEINKKLMQKTATLIYNAYKKS